MAKEKCICAQQIPGVLRSRLRKAGGGKKGSVDLPGKILSVTQFPWLHKTSLYLPVGGQRLHEAMFGECTIGNH